MAITAGSVASAADVNALLAATTPTTFTTTTPAGSGWYRTLLGGTLVQLHFESTGTVAATTAVTLNFTLPTGYRPAGRTPMTCTTGTSPRPGAANVLADGTITVYNSQSSSTTIYVDDVFAAA